MYMYVCSSIILSQTISESYCVHEWNHERYFNIHECKLSCIQTSLTVLLPSFIVHASSSWEIKWQSKLCILVATFTIVQASLSLNSNGVICGIGQVRTGEHHTFIHLVRTAVGSVSLWAQFYSFNQYIMRKGQQYRIGSFFWKLWRISYSEAI